MQAVLREDAAANVVTLIQYPAERTGLVAVTDLHDAEFSDPAPKARKFV